MTRRSGITVIEALMAILVMAIGLLALLTLFPLGAVSMWQALKDERAAEATIVATGQFNAFQVGSDPNVAMADPSGTQSIFENPWPPTLTALNPGATPTYPVYVDPIGQNSGLWIIGPTAGPGIANVGVKPIAPSPWPTMGGASNGIPRVTITAKPTTASTWQQRWFTLHDDLTYADNGLPDPGSLAKDGNTPISREGRYSWAYMVRRNTAQKATGVVQKPTPPAEPQSSVFDMTVVVYAARLTGLDANNNIIGEAVYGDPGSASPSGTVDWGLDANGTPNNNVVTINWGGAANKPPLRRGSWILDSRMLDANGKPLPQGYFYRVVSVTDVSATVMEVEVQRPLGGQLRAPIGVQNGGPLIVMENVAEVLEKLASY